MRDLPAGRIIYVDCDIEYEDFKTSKTLVTIIEKLPAVQNLIESQIVQKKMRSSSSGNAHILLEFDRTLTVFEMLQVRAWLHDDINRLMLDLVRYLRSKDPKQTNRLWSGKYKKVDAEIKLAKAGLWEELELSE